jgi:hypothetical protein
MKHRWDGIDYAILFNERDATSEATLIGKIENRFDTALSAIHSWPTGRAW